ncbi:hypothetical protein ACFLQV_04255 [Calditrichota bacterium]
MRLLRQSFLESGGCRIPPEAVKQVRHDNASVKGGVDSRITPQAHKAWERRDELSREGT